jgi:hypothetical protein
MRIHAAHGGLTVQAIAGTNVVLLGFDLNPSLTDGLMGFSIHRVDHTEGEERWLPNMLLFKVNDVESNPDRSSEHNPIQTFRWGDYTAKPGHTYSYTVMARDGATQRARETRTRRGESYSIVIRCLVSRAVSAPLTAKRPCGGLAKLHRYADDPSRRAPCSRSSSRRPHRALDVSDVRLELVEHRDVAQSTTRSATA